MATKKSVSKKASKASKSTRSVTAAQVTSVAKKAADAEERVSKAESRLRRLEQKTEKLKALDKVGVRKQVHGFVEFLREQSVVGLAIGLVLGTQAKALVDQLIASFINPLVGLMLPGQGALDKKIFVIHLNGKAASFGWGAFVIAILTFVIVAAVVYFVFKGLGLDKLDKKKEN